MTVLAVDRWPTNAALIRDVAELGWLRKEDRVLDPTYGGGLWWTDWRPDDLTSYCRPQDDSDFRDLPHPDGWFDAITFDPPYVAKGGRATSGIREMDDRYGQHDCPPTPSALQHLINDGLTEMARLVPVGGIILVRCKDYISSGDLFEGTYYTRRHAETLDLYACERFEYVTEKGGPQPPGRRQAHARRNASTLYVFRKGKGRKRIEPRGGQR